MNELKLIKAERFGETEADIYSNGQEMYMTIAQLAACLEYSSKTGLERLMERNPYLKNSEFSFIQKVPHAVGGTQKTRTFTEDGIYEVTMLSEQPKAQEFRAWIRGVLKALRHGQAQIISKPMTDYQQKMIETRERNSRIRSAQILERMAAKYHGTAYEQVLNAHATKVLTGEYLLPLPQTEKTYSATEVGEMLGVTAHRIGILSNQNGMKTEEYGSWYHDKSAYSAKEVDAFRYNDKAVEKFRELLGVEA